MLCDFVKTRPFQVLKNNKTHTHTSLWWSHIPPQILQNILHILCSVCFSVTAAPSTGSPENQIICSEMW